MRSPLTVRISDGTRDQHVTRFIKGLRFTKTAPGGHHSASVQIDAPDGLFGDLSPADRIFIYDGRNADTVWDGYVENPGRASVAGGARYDLSAMGGVVLASDNARAVVFVDHDLSHQHWQKVGDSAAQAGQDQSAVPSAGPGLKAQLMPGAPVGTGSSVGMLNSILLATWQPLKAVSAMRVGGKVDAGYEVSIVAYDDSGVPVPGMTPSGLGNTPAGIATAVGSTLTFAENVKQFAVLLARNGVATTVTEDTIWVLFYEIGVRPALMNKSGAWNLADPGSFVLVASEVVEHLIGSGMLQVDPNRSTVATTTTHIQQLAYLEGAKPHQILDDIALHEPDMLWEILESGSNGKHRFAYRAWPTTPRYEISGREFTESGGEMDLCNRIIVNWTDETGAKQTTIRTTTVPELGTRIKDAEPITLPDGQGSVTNAEHIGDQVLAALNAPTRSGTAVVRQPILDRLTGRMVMPWEIEPGYLVRVRDKGIDLRLTEMTYEDANCTASLTLGSPTLTLAQRIAKL